MDPTSDGGHGANHCGAKRRDGRLCEQPAGFGTQHVGIGRCKFHGGSTPTQVQHAAVVAEERSARTILERLGEPEPLGHPVEELLAVVAEQKAWQRILRERLAEHIETVNDLETTDKLNTEKERALVVLYERALDRTGNALANMVKLDLQSRMVQIKETEARDVIEAMVRAIHRAGLGDHELEIRKSLADELRDIRVGNANALERVDA